MNSTQLTKAQWERLAELRKRLWIRDERDRKRRLARYAREWRAIQKRDTAGDRKANAWFERDRREVISPEYAAKFLRIPVKALLAATSGQPFFMDFGPSWKGGRRQLFRSVELARFAAQQLRSKRARPAIAHAPRLAA